MDVQIDIITALKAYIRLYKRKNLKNNKLCEKLQGVLDQPTDQHLAALGTENKQYILFELQCHNLDISDATLPVTEENAYDYLCVWYSTMKNM